MANVPDHDIAGRIEHVVQRHGQLDDAEPRAQMPAGHRYGVDGFLAQFRRQLLQLLQAESADILRNIHRI